MSYSEWNSAFELLAMLFLDVRIAVLTALLAAAAVIDWRSHRIPNLLVGAGILFGLAYNLVLPPFPQASLFWAPMGMALGLIAFLPLYLLHAMGAGDVKLMAMVGAFVGPSDLPSILLYTILAGGTLSLLQVLANGTAARMASNLVNLFRFSFLDAMAGGRPSLRVDAASSAGRLPYALAIASGTLIYLSVHQLGLA